MTKSTIHTVLALAVALGAITWAHAQQRTPPGSLTTQDYIDIQQLYARYNQTLDRRDAEGWAGVFTAYHLYENDNLRISVSSFDEVRDLFHALLAGSLGYLIVSQAVRVFFGWWISESLLTRSSGTLTTPRLVLPPLPA